ncbi:hypothetical protein Rsub_00802 [Raphidocelis subcapitata]|uniref:Serine aminopeptidase S33 domain-containing protein n=1 Tax=Raphidocelis subcapitata TaxID=307507 RepID=A0A2V0NRA0_9CHLO|nr:hypothetical protein Rsub_00802 [Raphidocelis subcapitata]|eukprot:GBF88090.1 hypothetical protein Rsub_00802 [Raphidocelis subcapitata]
MVNPVKILALAVAAAVVLPWDVALIPGPFPRTNLQTENTKPIDAADYTRKTLRFPSVDGVECEAWLYAPKRPATRPPPVVMMGHGLGAQKDMGLHVYAERFAAAGMVVFVFDYRSFGGSDGEPRNWISPARHLDDWRAALRHVRGELAAAGAVDAGRLALWGTSYAGGHVLVMAGELRENVTAVVAQVPFLDGKVGLQRAFQTRGLLALLRNAAAGVHDLLRTALRQPPAYLPIAGGLGSNAMMQLDDHELGAYFAKHPKVYQGGWRNQARAAWALEASRYRPIASVPSITAPVLYITATTDSLCPPDVIAAAVAATPNARQKVMECTHFDVYNGQRFEDAVAAELEFLAEHLLPGGRAPAAAAAAAAEAGADGEGAHEEL